MNAARRAFPAPTHPDYCRELGVAIEPFANANADAYYTTRRPGFAGPLTDRRLRGGWLSRTISGTSANCSPRRSTSCSVLDVASRTNPTGPRWRLGPTWVFDSTRCRQPVRCCRRAVPLSDLLAANFGVTSRRARWDRRCMMFQPSAEWTAYRIALALRFVALPLQRTGSADSQC